MNTTAPGRDTFATFRRKLEVMVERLSGEVNQLAAEALRPVAADDAPAHAPAGTGTEADEAVARGVLASEARLLAEAQAALGRCSDGTFGACERCGRKIAQARLGAVPYARDCIRCARAAQAAPGADPNAT